MTYSPTLLSLIEDLRIRVVNDIAWANDTIFENVNHLVKFEGTHFNDDEYRIWYKFTYLTGVLILPIWARLNSEGQFVSVNDTHNTQYYTR